MSTIAIWLSCQLFIKYIKAAGYDNGAVLRTTQQMNFNQIFAALALCAISLISASPVPLTFTTSPSATTQVQGVSFIVNVSNVTTSYNAYFTDAFGNNFNASGLTPDIDHSITPVGLYGAVTLIAEPVDTTNYSNSAPVFFTINLPSLFISSFADLIYGQAVPLTVSTNGPANIKYTAYFACTSGSYQVTGLTTGVSYSIVPGGVYGETVITVTAENSNPGTFAFSLFKPSNNIPAQFINAHQRYYPSVYANMKDGGQLEILEVKLLDSILH